MLKPTLWNKLGFHTLYQRRITNGNDPTQWRHASLHWRSGPDPRFHLQLDVDAIWDSINVYIQGGAEPFDGLTWGWSLTFFTMPDPIRKLSRAFGHWLLDRLDPDIQKLSFWDHHSDFGRFVCRLFHRHVPECYDTGDPENGPGPVYCFCKRCHLELDLDGKPYEHEPEDPETPDRD